MLLKLIISRGCILSALALALTSCGKSGDTVNGDTTNNITNVNPPVTQFDGTSGNVDSSAWQVPRFGLSYHNESTAMTWTLDANVAGAARPGGIDNGFLRSGARTDVNLGSIAYSPAITANGSTNGDFAVVQELLTTFLGISSQRQLALSTDHTICDRIYYNGWTTYFPRSVQVGTTWQSDLINSSFTGRVFAYQSIGTVSYRPRIRSVAGPTPTSSDAQLVSVRVPVTAGNVITNDLDTAAVDYLSGPGYVGKWIDLQRVGRLRVTALDQTTPDSLFSGCVQVSLAYDYRLANEAAPGNTLLGLNDYAANYTLYWKPGIGWVYWIGIETTPQWGLGQLSAPTDSFPTRTFNLSAYNANYDFGRTQIYQTAWNAGYYAAYRDASNGQAPYYYSSYPADRNPLGTALSYAQVNFGLSDNQVQLDSTGTAAGKRAPFDIAFVAGYNLGITYYSQDYTENANAQDTLNNYPISRPYLNIDVNSVPVQFRRDAIWALTGFGISDILANPTITGYVYANGIDGVGETVDAYDGAITTGPSEIKLQKDAAGLDLRGVYISLPLRGTVTTKTITGTTTQSGLTNGGNG